MQAVEDIVNQALVGIGWKRPIGEIYEGSPASRAALEVYGQTRDELLAAGEWPFALREVTAAVNGRIPPSPWAAEFSYPADCLRLRNLRPGPLTGGGRNNDPQPVLFRPFNDNRATPAVRAVLCARVDAVLIYTGRVTNPVNWEPGFTKALIAALQPKLAVRLNPDKDAIRAYLGLAMQADSEGQSVNDMVPPALPGAPMPQQQPTR